MFSCHQCVREVIAAVDPPSSQQSRVDCIAPPRPQVRFTTVSPGALSLAGPDRMALDFGHPSDAPARLPAAPGGEAGNRF